MEEPSIVYERAGIKIIVTPSQTVFKKNGLTIEIPKWVLDDFEQEFDKALLRIELERSEP